MPYLHSSTHIMHICVSQKHAMVQRTGMAEGGLTIILTVLYQHLQVTTHFSLGSQVQIKMKNPSFTLDILKQYIIPDYSQLSFGRSSDGSENGDEEKLLANFDSSQQNSSTNNTFQHCRNWLAERSNRTIIRKKARYGSSASEAA